MAEIWCWMCAGRTDHSETLRGLIYKCVQCGTVRDLTDREQDLKTWIAAYYRARNPRLGVPRG